MTNEVVYPADSLSDMTKLHSGLSECAEIGVYSSVSQKMYSVSTDDYSVSKLSKAPRADQQLVFFIVSKI